MCWAGKLNPLTSGGIKDWIFQPRRCHSWDYHLGGTDPQLTVSTLGMNGEAFASGSLFTCTFLSCQSWEDIKAAKSKALNVLLEELPNPLDNLVRGNAVKLYMDIWAVMEFGRIRNLAHVWGCSCQRMPVQSLAFSEGALTHTHTHTKMIGTQVRKTTLSEIAEVLI